MRESAVTRWFRARHRAPTPAQKAAWPLIEAGRNVLVLSPTGTGKTLAAFLAVLNQLALEAGAGTLGDGIQALYVSPLRALGYDLEKNLRGPLTEIYGEEPPIRVGLRSGDTAESLAALMPPERDRLARFEMLNGLRPGEQPRVGSKVKVVVDGRR